jgi:rod shape-determining protein MreD
MALRAVWTYRMIWAGAAFAVIFVALLPLGTGSDGWPGPDIVLCLAIAWIVRRPDFVPVWLLVGTLLLEDVLLVRPLGLWTLIVLVAGESLRRRVDPTEAHAWGAEFALAWAMIAGCFAAGHLGLVLLLAETPPLGGQLLHMGVTMASYPLVAVATHLIGVRRLAPGEVDTLGTRA